MLRMGLRLDKMRYINLLFLFFGVFFLKGQEHKNVCLKYNIEKDSAIFRLLYDKIFTSSPQINFKKINNDSLQISYGYKLLNHNIEPKDYFKVNYFSDIKDFKIDLFGNKIKQKDSLDILQENININLITLEFPKKCINTEDKWFSDNDLHSSLYENFNKEYQLKEFNEKESKINVNFNFNKKIKKSKLFEDLSIKGFYIINNETGC